MNACLNALLCHAELHEEGLLLDALAITAQPLAEVASATCPEACRAVGLESGQVSVRCHSPPYQIQMRIHQVGYNYSKDDSVPNTTIVSSLVDYTF